MPTKALLIVDVQNDFLPGGALAIAGSDTIIEPINQLQSSFELIVATQDWHPPGHISFAATHGKKVGEQIEIDGVIQLLWPIHCLQHSVGAQLSDQLKQDRIARIFYKGVDKAIDSYSAFFDARRARSTHLDDYLKAQGVKELTVVGLATDYCVKYCVLDALELGFKVTVVMEGCAAVNVRAGDGVRALEEMRERGAKSAA